MKPDPYQVQRDNSLGLLLDKTSEAIRLELETKQLVLQCRMQGASWSSIGAMLGVSAQAAWERYRPNAPTRPIPGQRMLPLDSDYSDGSSPDAT